MAFPIEYDVLMRIEVEARNAAEAAKLAADDIATLGIEKAVATAIEVIRDDNTNPPKDNHSRHSNGFAIFTSTQKLDLVAMIVAALEAVSRGKRTWG